MPALEGRCLYFTLGQILSSRYRCLWRPCWIREGVHKNVRKAMVEVCRALAAFIDPLSSLVASQGRGSGEEMKSGYRPSTRGAGNQRVGPKNTGLLNSLKRLQTGLDAWRKTASVPQERVGALNKHHGEFILRFHSLLSSTNKPGHVESREAQRRIAFFVNSMFMRQPQVTRVETMPTFSTLTPYYTEGIIFSMEKLCAQTPDGVTTLEYLQTLFPQQWKALLERLRRTMPDVHFPSSNPDLDSLSSLDENAQLELRLWASYRAQTLARTVRGMRYYEQAIRMLAVVEADDITFQFHGNVNFGSGESVSDRSRNVDYVRVLSGDLKHNTLSRKVSRAKFTYVVSCQQHGKMLRSSNEAERAKAKDVERLMGMYPSLKEASMVFLVLGFCCLIPNSKASHIKILIPKELSFVTSIQRFRDAPLRVRFHYGHPDLFDKVSAITLGGISKASKGINLSEDIFRGFNFILRGGSSTQAEYIQGL